MSTIIPQKTRYYEVHVFISRENGYSFGIKIESIHPLEEDQIIQYAVDNELFQEPGDEMNVDYTDEIDEQTYNILKNI
jgi:hypothetical protein